MVLFQRKVPAFRMVTLGRFAGQMALASLAVAAALMGLQLLEPGPGAGSLLALGAYLVGAGVVGGGAFVAAAYLLNVHEIRDLWRRGRTWCQALVRDPRES